MRYKSIRTRGTEDERIAIKIQMMKNRKMNIRLRFSKLRQRLPKLVAEKPQKLSHLSHKTFLTLKFFQHRAPLRVGKGRSKQKQKRTD